MLFDQLKGKRLAGIQVLDPWRTPSPSSSMPLFGALALTFEHVALLCKSPLRYCRQAGGTLLSGSDGVSYRPGFRLDLCDLEQLAAYQGLLESPRFHPIPKRWQSVPSLGSAKGAGIRYGIEDALGARIAHIRITGTGLELVFAEIEHPLCIAYREDLDGAIQVAPPNWWHRITKIVLTQPEHAFGWLLDDAPYPLLLDGRQWKHVEHYATSFDAELMVRRMAGNVSACTATRISAVRATVDSLLREKARLCKFAQHPQLDRRLRAIRYPVVLRDLTPFSLLNTEALIFNLGPSADQDAEGNSVRAQP